MIVNMESDRIKNNMEKILKEALHKKDIEKKKFMEFSNNEMEISNGVIKFLRK